MIDVCSCRHVDDMMMIEWQSVYWVTIHMQTSTNSPQLFMSVWLGRNVCWLFLNNVLHLFSQLIKIHPI